MALTEKLTAVADAIRAKSGKTAGMTLAQMPTEIANIKTGVELAFEVVPNPQPSSPTENTIWVDTDTINGWAFSATAPESPTANMVWISTGLSSPAAFNVLAEGNVTVYPISAKQYVSGEWVSVTAQTYQSGAWVDWMMYLYREGNTFDALTGGYMTKLLSGDYGAPTVEFQTDRIYVNTTGASQPMVRTREKINLSGISSLELYVDGIICSTSESFLWFFVSASEITSKNPTISDGAIVKYTLDKDKFSDTELHLSLDVSGVTDSMYVYALGYSALRLGTNSFYIREIRGEA